jgi:parvulin-like peptidyl-prolyl isomerase
MGNKDEVDASAAFIQVVDGTISESDLLFQLKVGAGDEFLATIARRKAALAIAARHNIDVTDEEIDAAASRFFVDQNIFEPEQEKQWRESRLIDESALHDFARENAIIERARLEVISDELVRTQFSRDHHGYARAVAEVYEFTTTGLAREFILDVRENEFLPRGGYRRELGRQEAPEEIAAELFAAEPGELVGPLENDDGAFIVYLLRDRQDAELDDDLAAEIRGRLFDELIESELARDPIQFLK